MASASLGTALGDVASLVPLVEEACGAMFRHESSPAHGGMGREQADTVLREFRQGVSLSVAVGVLQTARMPDARFQAAIALREAIIRCWDVVSREETDAMQQTLFTLLASEPAMPVYLRTSVAVCLVVGAKRRWFSDGGDAASRDHFFSSVEAALRQPATLNTALLLLTVSVTEFALATASGMALPWEFHRECCDYFEGRYLRRCYELAAEALHVSVSSHLMPLLDGNSSTPPQLATLSQALELMGMCLQWDFSVPDGPRTSMAGAFGASAAALNGGAGGAAPLNGGAGQRNADVSSLLCPGPAWRDTVLNVAKLNFLASLDSKLARAVAEKPAGICTDDLREFSRLGSLVRRVLLALCGMAGSVFGAEGGSVDAGQYQAQRLEHLNLMISAVGDWFSEKETNGRDRAGLSGAAEEYALERIIDCCLAVRRLSLNYGYEGFMAVSEGRGVEYLRRASNLTKLCIAPAANEFEDQWKSEGIDILLEAWHDLACGAPGGKGGGRRISGNNSVHGQEDAINALPRRTFIREAVTPVFETYVARELQSARIGAADDEDDVWEELSLIESRRLIVAQLGRADPFHSIPALRTALADSGGRYSAMRDACNSSGQSILHVPGADECLEELCYLLNLSGLFLADEGGGGETPMVPDSLVCVRPITGFDPPGTPDYSATLVLQLSSDLLGFCQGTLDAVAEATAAEGNFLAADRMVSPRLLEAMFSFLARWSDTYVVCDPAEYGGRAEVVPLLESFSFMSHGGVQILDFLVRSTSLALSGFAGEIEVHKLALKLLHGITARKGPSAALMTLETWRSLLGAHMSRSVQVRNLEAARAGELVECLFRASSGFQASASPECAEYVAACIRPIESQAAELKGLAEKHGGGSMERLFRAQPGLQGHAIRLLEEMRGMARGTTSRSHKAAFDSFLRLSPLLLTVFDALHGEDAVVTLILQCAEEVAGAQVVYLGGDDLRALVSFSVALIQSYSAHNLGRRTVGRLSNKDVAVFEEDVKFSDLTALLDLLGHLATKECADPSEAGSVGALDAPVLVGLSVVVPLLSGDLLKFAELRQRYYAVLSSVLEDKPGSLAQLPTPVLQQLVGTLHFGITHEDAGVARVCVEGVGALARHELVERKTQGLGPEATAATRLGHEGVLRKFLQSLLEMLLFGEYSADLVDPCADAVFALVACDSQAYVALAQHLLGHVGATDATRHARLEAAFGGLHAGVGPGFDRANRKLFRANFRAFLSSVRAFLRIK